MDVNRLIDKYEADHAIDRYAVSYGESDFGFIDCEDDLPRRPLVEELDLDLAA